MKEFTFYNLQGELTLSCDAKTYSYLGIAARDSLVQPFGTQSSGAGMQAGYSTYKFTWAGDVLPLIVVNSAGSCSCVEQSRAGDVWTFTLQFGDGTTNVYGFEYQAWTTVYVFGAPLPNTVSNAILYDTNQVPCADLSKRPLTFKSLFSLASNGLTTPKPGGTIGIMGGLSDYKVQYNTLPDSSYVATYSGMYWHYNTATGNVERRFVPYQRINSSFNGGDAESIKPAFAAFIDLAGLS